MWLLLQPYVQVSPIGSSAGNSNLAVMARARRNSHVDCLFRMAKPDCELSHCSAMHVLKRQRHLSFGLRGTRCAATRSRASSRFRICSAAAHASHSAKQSFEEVAERASRFARASASEEVFHIDGAAKAAARASPVRRRGEIRAVLPIRSKLVVLPALVRVAEDFVRFLDFFELLFGLFVVRVQVRMVFAGELAVCLLEFVFLGGSRNTEDFVVIAKLYCHVPEFTTE